MEGNFNQQNLNEHPIKGLMDTAMQKIREMVDVNTVVGDIIKVSDEVSIVPVSKVSFGFASGGSDLPVKVDKNLFGGGSGAGITILPLAFLVITNQDVRLLQVSSETDYADKLLNVLPGAIDKLSALLGKKKKDNKKETDTVEEI